MTRLRRLAEFLGLRRSIVGLLTMAVLVGMGERMAERFLPLYLIALGAGARWPGYLNALDNLLSALYSFPGGYLSDRLGEKRSLLVFNALAASGYLLVILVPTKEAVLAGAILFLSWTAISLPATVSLVTRALPQGKRVMGVTVHSLVRRVPMALGPVIGGALIARWDVLTGVRLAFIVALAMSLVAMAAQQLLIEPDPARSPGAQAASLRANPFRVLREMGSPLRRLLVADILVRFAEHIPYAYVVVWCVRSGMAPPGSPGISAFEFGILTAIEMATAMLVYVPVAYLADRSHKKPFVAVTFVFFALFPLILPFAGSFPLLVAAFVVRGLKEFGEPTRKLLIMELGPQSERAAAFGAYYLFRDAVVSVAAFAGAFLWEISPMANFLTAFAFGAAGVAWFLVLGRDVPTRADKGGGG